MDLLLKKVALIFGVGMAILLIGIPAFSQGNTGRILGNITDATGALIPGASVTITSVERGTSRTLVTDEAGAYNAPSLPPGTYQIRAELSGFKTVERQNATAIQLSRPLNSKYPYYSYIYTVSNPLYSNYNGAQVTLTQRVSHGLATTVGFTFSHALDQQTGERGGPNGTPFNYRSDYGSSDFDIRKRFTATATYALPSKSGFGQLLQGWKVTSIVTLQSALPWGVLGSRSADPSGIAEFQDRWNFYGDTSDFSGRKTDPVPFFLPGTAPLTGRSAADLAINNPACTSKVGPPGSLSYVSLQKWGCFVEGNSVMLPPAIGSYGNMTRNMFRGNGLHTWDASLMKDWKLSEKVTGQFRAEVFNLLNQTQYGNPQFNGAGGNLPFGGPGSFGASQSTPDVANNNPALGSGGPREFQFGFKVIY